MKPVFKIFFLAVAALFIMYTQADARGEIPPPPPFMGGNVGDWLGSGPVFGFEEPSLRNPWMGGGGSGGNSDPFPGGSGGGGGNGGWGGKWWEANGPLGGGGWGGWGGWGSGLGPGSGGIGIDTDTSKKGHIWPNDKDIQFNSCFVSTPVGGYSKCSCYYVDIVYPSGTIVNGHCEISPDPGGDPRMYCQFTGTLCRFTAP